MRCSSEAWVGGMVWGGGVAVGGIGQPATTTTTTHVSLRVFRAFPTPLIFLYFIISVQLQSVSESLSRVSFFLSLSFFCFFWGGRLFLPRAVRVAWIRARVFSLRVEQLFKRVVWGWFYD